MRSRPSTGPESREPEPPAKIESFASALYPRPLILTAGVGLLAGADAERIKGCFSLTNSAARDLYLGAGFRPDKQTTIFSRKGLPRAGPAQDSTPAH